MKKILLITAIAASAILTACGGGAEPADVAELETPEVMAAYDQANAELPVVPLASIKTSSSYLSPAEVRTRYGFDALPTTPSGTGSGKLIAIISAYNNPNIAKDLAAFSARYNLPQCVTVPTTYARLPSGYWGANTSKPAAGVGCTFQVVNVDSFGRATTAVPVSNQSDWVAESSMDVEWAHAMAPGASIILIQAPTTFVGAMGYAAMYASTVAKADVVSMSWGIKETSIQCSRRPGKPNVKYVPTCSDEATAAAFWKQSSRMFTGQATYVAASGDTGVLLWPSIHPDIMAVGGTVLGTTVDTAWTGSGGGVSTSFPATAAQAGHTKQPMRSVPDVAYDAGTPIAVYITPDAKTGLSDADCVRTNGVASCGWYAGGGTSAGAPQWSGLLAIAKSTTEADRAPAVTNYLTKLYSDIAAAPEKYSTAFGDVISGGQVTNAAKAGYDTVTGLGVPNAGALVDFLK